MTCQRTNKLSDLYLAIIILSGVIYTLLLGLFIIKVFPGFIMQIIFLFDSVKFNNSMSSLIFSQMFLINTTAGIALTTLLFRYIKALLITIKSIRLTHQVIGKSLTMKKNNRYYQFLSNTSQVFTAGLFVPKVYVSTNLIKSHTSKEVEAMIYHEENHQRNYHPLKTMIARLVQSFLPPIPGKNWLIDNYVTMTEVSSDQFAETAINSKLPLVSALLKWHKLKPNPFLVTVSNYFNSQSARIHILVGRKGQPIKTPFAYALTITIIMFVSTLYLKNTSIFFDCRHIIDCITVLVNPNSRPLLISLNTNSISNPVITSDHCQ